MDLGFTTQRVMSGDVAISVNTVGQGEPLLLIHGYPETHLTWYAVIPELAKQYTVVCPDLRGYGASDKPAGEPDHANYSKRAMAQDMIAVMDALGFDRFRVVAHDRGARVAHRLCLDHPQRVSKVALVDIVPTTTLYDEVTREVATAYFHWFFLIQPAPLPEKLIGGDPKAYLHMGLGMRTGGLASLDEDVLRSFEESFCDADAIHASCEDYRAAASIDLEHDRADSDKKIECPLLVIWGTEGPMGRCFDVPGTWESKATSLSRLGIASNHYVQQEAPGAFLDALAAFL